MLGKRIASAIVTGTLVAALVPAVALASPLQPTDLGQQAGTQLSTQATSTTKAKKSSAQYVLKSVKIVEDYGYGNVNRTVKKYAYNKKNLATQRTTIFKGSESDSKATVKWRYKGSNLASSVKGQEDPSPTYTDYNTTSKGKIKSFTATVPGTGFLEGMDNVTTTTMSYKGGKIASTSTAQSLWQLVRLINGTSMNREGYDLITNYSSERYYYNKKGLLRVLKTIDPQGEKRTYRFKYDKQGNVSKASSDYATYSCDNTYNKNGLLTKRTITNSESSSTVKCTFKWKKVKVKKSLQKKVEAQQWSLVNGDMNQAFGESAYGSATGQYWW